MARRRTYRRYRRGRRKGGGALWLLPVVIVVFFLLPPVLEFLRSSWMPLALVVAVLALAAGGGVVVTRRVGAAYRREALLRTGLDRLTPQRFEELTAELMRRDGFGKVRVVGGAGDRGVDVVGVAPGGVPYAVQCKYYTRHVGPGDVRDFVGALQDRRYRGRRGVLVTSHYLSVQARQTAGEQQVLVIDRDRLADWLLEVYRLGPGRDRVSWVARLRQGWRLRAAGS
ncbi:restriction endonuclease [Nonomuraea sp. NBC_01738]|uniref:restriction endonuclease n=1 Tax=Nonomuraea sp. NBC_01738 TaxID=2976003 RepID=UPI002E15CB60|nr:restriction endonuclease [Nonomuraea sp. NBC_01738]